MRQLTLATVGFERYGKTTRRAAFSSEMERVVPWPALCALIEPVYPKPSKGRPPIGLERMHGERPDPPVCPYEPVVEIGATRRCHRPRC